MKKVTISVEYDETKMKALKYFLEQKGNKTVSEKLVETLDSLYKKNVPLNVRDYIESSSNNSNSNTGNKWYLYAVYCRFLAPNWRVVEKMVKVPEYTIKSR